MHRIRFGGISRDDRIQKGIHAVDRVIRRKIGADTVPTIRKIGQQAPAIFQRLLIRIGCQMRQTAFREMNLASAQRLGVDLLAGHRFDHIRPGEKHKRFFPGHNDKIGRRG